jgi:hypothetical protein
MSTTEAVPEVGELPDAARPPEWRESLRQQALKSALQKRAAGVPTYSVPETAALMSVSQEYLYRLIQADAFPAIRMRARGSQGRYVVPALAVEQLLGSAIEAGCVIESADFTERWLATIRGGAA